MTRSKILKDQLAQNLRSVLNDNRTKEEVKESSRQKTRERLTQYRKLSQPPQKPARKKIEAKKPMPEIKPSDVAKIEPVVDKNNSKTEVIQQKVGSVVNEINEGLPKVASSPEPDNQPVRISLGRISSSDIIVSAVDNLFEEKPNRQRPVTSHSKYAAFRSKIAPVDEKDN